MIINLGETVFEMLNGIAIKVCSVVTMSVTAS